MAPPRPLTHAPKNPARRSKEEREQLDKRESQLRQARADASAADAAAESAKRRAYFGIQRDPAEYRSGADVLGTYRGGLGGSLRYVRGGRGGFMGQREASQRALPTEKKKKKPAESQGESVRPADADESTAPSAGTRRRSTRRAANAQGNLVAAEDGEAKTDIKTDPEGDVNMSGVGTQPGTKEAQDPAYISSDDEKTLGQNIEFINLVSDDDDDDDLHDGSAGEEMGRRRTTGLQPLRLIRKPHRDRNIPFNTDASSAAGANLRRDRPRADDDTSLKDTTLSGSRKGKARSRDVEVLRERRRWTGAYEDDIVNGSSTAVKQEAREETEPNTTSTVLDGDAEDAQNPTAGIHAEGSGIESKEAVAARIRNRRKATQAANKHPIFQTWEEEREYLKRQQDLEDVQYELGHISVSQPKARASEAGASGTAEMTEAVADKKEDAVYLFQLPPIIPDLIESTVKQEPQSPEMTARAAPASSTLSVNPTTSGPIKLEDDLNPSNSQETAQRSPQFAAGKVGKLRIHRSGRATLTWGGTSMEVSQGMNPHFLQSVVLANMAGASSGGVDESMTLDGVEAVGEATSFGQVRGKLVVTPDWSEILG